MINDRAPEKKLSKGKGGFGLLELLIALTILAVGILGITKLQMQSSFGAHKAEPGRLVLREDVPGWVRAKLREMGYRVETRRRTSGPITAIYFDREHGTMWGGASDYGEDYGLAW